MRRLQLVQRLQFMASDKGGILGNGQSSNWTCAEPETSNAMIPISSRPGTSRRRVSTSLSRCRLSFASVTTKLATGPEQLLEAGRSPGPGRTLPQLEEWARFSNAGGQRRRADHAKRLRQTR
jgi:hypothetical protein